MNEAEPVDHGPWPLRALILLALGAACGLIVHFLTQGMDGSRAADEPLRMAGASFVAAGALVFAFSLERLRWRWSAMFGAAAGSVVALVGWWNGSPEQWGAGEGWQFFASLVAIAFAVPLFQAIRDSGGRRFPVRAAHSNAWTNLILWCAAWAFVGATLLLTFLLSELFRLIGIDLIRDLLEEGWFPTMLVGAALGGAVGLLRDRDNVLHLLQKVVRAILSVLAPVLALGLVLFVAALLFTGLEPLWSQTKSTTPILLVCILGAIVLVNAVVGNGADEEARSPLLRWAAIALAAVMLPLALVAAVSTGKRIGQYGLTPDRMWACVFVLAAAAFALAYLYALVRRRAGWPEALRSANVRLAAGLCLLALFLALPIVSFGAISTRDQIARLESGRVAPDQFDWAAMRFDYGRSGRRALERLAASPNLVVRQRAREALRASDRWAVAPQPPAPGVSGQTPLRLRVEGGASVPAPLADLLRRTNQCGDDPCRLVFVEPKRAVLLRPGCGNCYHIFDLRPDGTWVQRLPAAAFRVPRTAPADSGEGRVEVRKVERQQLFVDGQPVGDPFE